MKRAQPLERFRYGGRASGRMLDSAGIESFRHRLLRTLRDRKILDPYGSGLLAEDEGDLVYSREVFRLELNLVLLPLFSQRK